MGAKRVACWGIAGKRLKGGVFEGGCKGLALTHGAAYTHRRKGKRTQRGRRGEGEKEWGDQKSQFGAAGQSVSTQQTKHKKVACVECQGKEGGVIRGAKKGQ